MIIFTMLGSIIGGGDTLNKRRDYYGGLKVKSRLGYVWTFFSPSSLSFLSREAG